MFVLFDLLVFSICIRVLCLLRTGEEMFSSMYFTQTTLYVLRFMFCPICRYSLDRDLKAVLTNERPSFFRNNSRRLLGIKIKLNIDLYKLQESYFSWWIDLKRN